MMGVAKYLLLFSVCTSFQYIANACTMEDVDDWRVTQDLSIIDVQRGTFWNKSTSEITSLTSITAGGGVNYANYLNVVWDSATNRFTISTSDGYEQYEENETSQTISFTVFFQCTGGSNSLIFDIAVQDTNNNPPTFMLQNQPTEQYEFTVTPPLPPGFLITGCGGDDIIVRDIDLTTSAIEFTIEDNPYFEIEYAGRSSSSPKEFLASLKTKDLIRSLSQDIELTVSATDVDGTGDPRITRTATIRVKADEAFLFPEEPVFTQPFYTATYENNLVALDSAISLRQGYDGEVIFSLDGEYSGNFRLVTNGNGMTIEVVNALPSEVFRRGQVLLVVKAEREYTSGATATVIVQLPEVLSLAFEQTQYEGRIVDNVLETLQVTLAQGYQDGFNVSLQNEYASYFSTSTQGNVVTLQMSPLEANIIDANNYISLQVIASNEFSSATAVVTLDIVKDDNTSPVFENAIYTGDYDQITGLTIGLSQGYDQTVNFSLSGDHAEYFSINNTGAVITLSSSGVPVELWPEEQLLLTISASKPRLVTATTTVVIRLPAARELAFAQPTYTGTIQDSDLTLQAIVLSVGHDGDVNFTLAGDYATYFTLSPTQNGVTVTLSTQLPDDVITGNSFLALTVLASGVHTTTASTVILLEIIKQDVNTPVFTELVYAGVYLGPNSIEIGNISLSQGYDGSVVFRLEGEYAENFKLSGEANNLNLELVSDVQPDVIFSKQVLVFSVLAEKPLTVGAHAAVSIAFPRDLTETAIMQFAQNTYIGSIENNNLVLDSIVLENGYENGTEFSLSGEYQSYFAIQSSGNVINITTQNPLPQEILENNEFIILEIEANRERAVSIPASVVIDIKKEEIIPLAFSNAYYKSVLANGSLENVTISLAEGYDETVTFELQGDNAIWFLLENVGNNVQLTLNTSMGDIPAEIIQNNDYFIFSIIANKPDANSARAAIFVHLPKETTETSMVRFSQASYVGRIENGTLYAPVISLAGELEPISFNITGEFSSFFEVSQTTPTNVEIRLRDGSLPANIVELPFIILDIEAYYPEAISGQTTVILEVVTEPGIVTPVFEQAYYTGEFSMLGGLTFDQSIRLSQGFDENVLFTLAGDDAQWFELSDTTENNFTLILKNSELGQVTDRSHLVFSVVASKNNSVAGSSAVVVSLLDYTTTSSIRFAQNLYRGSIENNTLTLGSIVMEEGYSDDLNISFTGDYMEYLELSHEGGIFTLQILPQMPDSVINENKVLVFTLQAKNGNSRTHTTIVLDIVKAEPIRLSFEEVYYVGSYSVNDGFIFDPQITLSEGYDETVLFSLEGDDSQWFGIIENQYPISLTQINPIPNDVIANNKHLIFAILAENPGNMTTRSTIVITLSNDSDMTILRFEQTAYLGTLESNTISLDTILLSDGYNQNVTFSLQGDLREYFTVSNDGASVTVSLSSSIPESQLPSNGIIILELQASAPNAFSAFSTIFFTIESENTAVEHLAFSNNYYTGHYTEADGLVFNDVIELMEAYNETVQFTLEGESSQYFGLERTTGNSVTLNLTSPIPSAVALNNHHLIFTIKAEKTGTVAGKATIIIALFDGFSEDTKILGFERVTYMGTLENNTLNFEEIILSNGHSDNVTFRLFGDLESYFGIESNGSTVTLALDSSIPEQSLPENGIIVLELEASATGFMSANAAIIITVVREEMNASFELLIFSEAYYTGHYAETAGLAFTDEIRLTEGFDTNVTFALEGESSQYFDAVVASDSVSLKLILPIPSSVVMNNRQLIFTIRAEKPDAISARATIVISLLDDFNDTITILGFDKINYLGSLEQSTLNLDPITLTEGYSDNVTFSLQGALNNYFAINSEGPIVAITLNNTIPVESMPENKIIILELLASAPDSLSAHATIVIEIIQEENPMLEQLFFSSAYYTGSYMESEGFTFTDNITLSEGYDSNVTFKLEGDDSQYFEVDVSTENSVSLRQISSIPSAVAASRHQFIFSIIANKSDAIPARAAIVIALYDDLINNNTTILGFERINYLGSLEQNTLNLDPITLSEGYSDNVTFSLQGALNNYFAINSEGPIVTITLNNTVPVESMPENKIIILELLASAPDSLSAHATIVIEIIQEEKPMLEQLIFSSAYYTGSYTESEGFTLTDNITLSGGYDSNVTFKLEGDDSQYFEVDVLTENSVSLRLISSIPSAVAASRHQFIFSIIANKSDAIPARAAIVIALYDDLINNNTTILGFEKINYLGSLEQNTLNLDSITLSEGYSDNVTFSLQGALNNYFAFNSEGPIVTITLNTTITVESMPENKIIILELLASAPDSLSAHATIVIEIIQEETPMLEQLIFSSAYYTGSYTESEGFTFTDNITLSEGYDSNVTFKLEGDDSQYFEVDVLTENSLSLRLVSSIPSAVAANRHQFIFTIIANKSDAIPARATIIIALYDELNETRPVLGFNRISYVGSIEGDVAKIDLIFVSEGYSSDVNYTLYGELQNYFTLIRSDNSVNVSLISPIPQEMVPSNRIIVLEIQASAPDTVSAHATIVFEVVQEDVGEMIFNEPFYTGQYNVTDGLSFGSIISLSQGYDDTVQFTLDGDDAEWFQLSGSGNSVSIVLASAIPEDVLQSKRKLIFVILAQKPGTFTRATIIISLVNDAVVSESSFGKILYEGIVQSGQVFHEAITLTGYNGTDVALLGENAALFSATHSEGTVVIQGRGNVTLSPDASYMALQLQAGAASAVLVLDVEHSDNPDLPSVSFNASSYVLNTNVNHVGPIGLVFASADNDEAVAYSLRTDDPYLLQRLAVSQYGEIVLWARMNSGVYNFDVIATTVFSKVSASVPVHLTVEAVTIIDDNNYILPPLQILNRDEESPHMNLVPFNASTFEGCRLSLSNRWPADQNWLYVDENGVHTTAIDREHESIAFMAQSQIQVELVLNCDGDDEIDVTRAKRSADLEFTNQLEHLGPYDYGNSRWILTDSIIHNPRRSLVNLIVNDINDNAPVFIGKENEPIIVGYPVADLENRILPRALIEVKATDADVGENAAIVYWSTAEALAVSPTTGLVHVRDIAGLENDMTLTIQATDRNGQEQGLTGSLDIIVKLIDSSHIAVVTIQDAFLDDEQDILTNLSAAVGYEVKALRSTMISDTESSEVNSRKKREAQLSTGASIQLYVYGLIEREPVNVERLTEDINTSVIETLIVASTVSLEDHLEICPLLGRDTALFVSTIVLAVLLFLLIVAAAVWFFLKWRKENYQQFSDENSLASQDVPVSPAPVNVVKPELPTPRMNIEDLKKSERRLQEMLESPAPLQNSPPSTLERSKESKVNMPEPPLVFQSFDKLKSADDTDDEDEFGEIKKNRRKSVVTFNENVEKIIHVEDTPDDDPDIEVYRL